MASLRQLTNSPYWIACFTLPDGRRTQRSTGTTNKREALRIACQFEDASREAKAGRYTETRARKTIADIYSIANQEILPSSKITDYFNSWLKRKELEAGTKTNQRYASVVSQFIDFLGPLANRDIAHLSHKDITRFREVLSNRVTPGTVNVSIKVLRAALNQAKRDGLVDVNEAERVTLIKRNDKFQRRPFTLPELQTVLRLANEEWKGMILVGLYTGQRLGDIANLCWNNLDLARQEIHLTTEKTSRRQILPLAKPLLEHLETLPAGDDPNAPLFPQAYAARQRSIHSGTLSNQFYQILVAAGLAKAKTHKSIGKGRSVRREQNELSFHALRHTATSLLKNAGVSDAVARDIIGHDSVAVSDNYTHIDMETKRRALNQMPSVT